MKMILDDAIVIYVIAIHSKHFPSKVSKGNYQLLLLCPDLLNQIIGNWRTRWQIIILIDCEFENVH